MEWKQKRENFRPKPTLSKDSIEFADALKKTNKVITYDLIAEAESHESDGSRHYQTLDNQDKSVPYKEFDASEIKITENANPDQPFTRSFWL